MPQLRLKVATSKQRRFLSDAQDAWEEFEEAIWEMCQVAGVDEGAAGDLLSDMRLHIEMIWAAHDVSEGA